MSVFSRLAAIISGKKEEKRGYYFFVYLPTKSIEVNPPGGFTRHQAKSIAGQFFRHFTNAELAGVEVFNEKMHTVLYLAYDTETGEVKREEYDL